MLIKEVCTMSKKIVVVGKTSPKEIMVASIERQFVLDEYLLIKDELHGTPVAEVMETEAYPHITVDTFSSESGIYTSLKEAGFLEKENTIYMAKCKLLEELQTPITPSSEIEIPNFEDIEELLMKRSPQTGFTLGIIRGTEQLQSTLPEHLQNVAPLFEKGEGVIDQQGIPFVLDYYAFREYPHIGLFGGSGSGKTYGLRVICEEVMSKGIPGVVLDPHYELSFQHGMDGMPSHLKEDYSDKHELFQVGENVGIKFTDLSTEELSSLLQFVGDLTQPMMGALDQLHQKNDSYTTLSARIQKLIEAFEYHEVPEHKRTGDLSDDTLLLFEKHKNKVAGLPTLRALSWRLDQLFKTGIFNSDISQIEACMMKRKLAVVRGKQFLLIMLSSYLIRKIYYKRRSYKDWEQVHLNKRRDGEVPPKFPPFFLVMDEAHVFAPNGERANPTKRILKEISQEARKYGVFEILGTQSPSLLDKTIASQLNTKIIFRTTIESDMRMIQTETNLNDVQMTRLPDLTTGNAFISSATLQKTFYVRFRATKTVSPHDSHPFDELDDYGVDHRLKDVLLNNLPIEDVKINSIHSKINRELGSGQFVDVKTIFETLDMMVVHGEIQKETSIMGVRYKKL